MSPPANDNADRPVVPAPTLFATTPPMAQPLFAATLRLLSSLDEPPPRIQGRRAERS